MCVCVRVWVQSILGRMQVSDRERHGNHYVCVYMCVDVYVCVCMCVHSLFWDICKYRTESVTAITVVNGFILERSVLSDLREVLCCLCVCVGKLPHTHTHTHAHTHAHTHTCMYVCIYTLQL